jgi:DNA-binding MarR family transcriptional regulator
MRKIEYETLAAFRSGVRKFLSFSEEAARAQGLTPQQYQALLAIEGAPGRREITMGELAEQLHITAHSAVGLADRLQKAKLIVRHAAEGDRRHVFVKLTPLGRRLLGTVAAKHRKELRTAGPLLVDLLERVKRL